MAAITGSLNFTNSGGHDNSYLYDIFNHGKQVGLNKCWSNYTMYYDAWTSAGLPTITTDTIEIAYGSNRSMLFPFSPIPKECTKLNIELQIQTSGNKYVWTYFGVTTIDNLSMGSYKNSGNIFFDTIKRTVVLATPSQGLSRQIITLDLSTIDRETYSQLYVVLCNQHCTWTIYSMWLE